MSADFSKYLIVSDLDGTLVDYELNVLQKDKDAIQRFVDGGGSFAVCTGRAIVSARPFAEMVAVNIPCVFFNGAVVYDLSGEKEHYATYLPDNARECVKSLLKRFPNMRAAVLRDNNYYDVTPKDDGIKPFAIDGVETVFADIDTLPYPWYKILFNIMEYDVKEIAQYAKELNCPGISFMSTTAFYYEMMSEGITKAHGLKKLIDMVGAGDKTVVAIGDYYNDKEMIEMADIGVTVANAPDDLKAVADVVVGDVRDGALSQLIDYIENLI